MEPVPGILDQSRSDSPPSDLTLDPAGIQAGMFELQKAVDLESLWRATRSLLDNVLQLHSCSLMLGITDYEPSLGRHHVVEAPHPDYEPATTLKVSQGYLYAHPRIKLYTYSQIVSEDPSASQRRLAQEPFVIGGWAEFVHLAFWHDQRLEAVLSLRRGDGHPRFSAHEMGFLEKVYPMIDAALHRLQVFEHERARRMPLERFLHSSPFPVMFIDADGTPLFATAEARRCYERWTDGLSAHRLRDSGVRLPADIQALLERACARVARGPDYQPAKGDELLIRHPAITGLSVRVDVSWPVSSGAPVRPSYVLTFTLPGNEGVDANQLSPNALRVLQRLSPTERRVALLVLEGLRNDEISERLCRSRRTIEFQLNSIYRKLDVSSRTHLVRLLA